MGETPPVARKLVVIVGETASGKTDLAVRLAALAGGEIVSADSVQIYQRFDVGSGKPTALQRQLVPHHLVDELPPLAPMDAAGWAAMAAERIGEISARGNRPLVCGGTFLWVRALLFGLAAAPPAHPEIRERHREWALREGRQALHARLQELDPPTAARLSPNDFVRVSRALEVQELSGEPMSAWQSGHGFRAPKHDALLVGIKHPRAALDSRQEARAHAMLGNGWVDEVRTLLADGLGEARAMRSVGYRQIVEELRGVPAPDGADLPTRIYRATRVLARRQRTWLRDEPVIWLTPEDAQLPEEVWTTLKQAGA